MVSRIIFSILATLAPVSSFAAADVGKIVEIYAHPSGQMALRLDNGLPNSNLANNCGVTGNVWAGVAASDSNTIKSAMLAAKSSGSPVTLVTLATCVGT
jgi:hypothetical protein